MRPTGSPVSPNRSDDGALFAILSGRAQMPEWCGFVVNRLGYSLSTLLLAVLLLAVLLLPRPAHADAAPGERLARQWCATCHVIDGIGPKSTVPQGPPPFRAVAHRLDRAQLRNFLSHPHGAMPDLALTRAEIADLIAYIESLK